MKTLNPMFEKKIVPLSKPARKTRSDKQMDVKVAVSLEEKEILRSLNYRLNKSQSMTQFASNLVKEGLEIPYIEHSPYYPVSKEKEYIHIKLTEGYQLKLVNISAKWNCSLRMASRRILINLLYEVKGDIEDGKNI